MMVLMMLQILQDWYFSEQTPIIVLDEMATFKLEKIF
jgi:hypothetical protein